MPDLYHQWGQDLQVTASGDLAVVDGTVLGQQRVLRRLLTNQGDYIWHLGYGAGLPARVGQLLDRPALIAAIRSQMFQEPIVSQSPLPTVDIRPLSGDPGSLSVNITYVDAQTGQQVALSFDVSP